MVSVNINNECLICLAGPLIDSNGLSKQVESILLVPYINRTCKCQYYIHQQCLTEWLATKPSCPFCGKPVFMEELYIPVQIISRDYNYRYTCIIVLIACLVIFFFMR